MEAIKPELLKHALPFWGDLTASQRELLLQSATLVRYTKGEFVHGCDGNCLGLLAIRHGGLCVSLSSEEGREITLFRLDEGDLCVMSAACVIRQITFDVHIDAESDSELLLINSGVLGELMRQNVHVECFVYKLAVESFSDVMWTMQQVLFMGFDRRLAIFLLEERARSGCDVITMTHEYIARRLGSAREVVTRMLKRFSDEGMVALHRGTITICDWRKLAALAGQN
jgi:CRP/FNR family transcriptional regulator